MSSDKSEIVSRIYVVPLGRAWDSPKHRRANRAMGMIREFAERHMKSSEIKISTELNELIWVDGIRNPPRRVTVKMEKDEAGVVTVSLPPKE